MDSQIFEKLSPTKLMFRCAVPSMISMVFGALYQIADGLFVGRFVGGDALAAVNLIMPIIMIAFALSDMIAAGAGVRVSILLGKKDREGASQVFSSTIKLIFIVSCIFGLLGFFGAESLLRLIAPGANEEAIRNGIIYMRIHAFFAPVMPIGFATDNFLRACGKEKASMWIGIISQSMNIVLDIILIAFMGQGIWAAAFTSCIAMAFMTSISLWMFRGKHLDLYYTRKNISPSALFSILANGSSEFFSNISMSVMSMIYNFFLLKFGGTTAVAAFSVIMYVDSIIGMFVFGLCGSLQPAISYCYGAGLIAKVRAIFRRIVLGAVLLSVLSMLFMIFAGPYVAPLFIKPEDVELYDVSVAAMKIFSLSYLAGWVDMCFSSYFTALECPVRSLLTSIFGTLVFPALFLFILTPLLKLDGVWFATIVAGIASAALTMVFFRTMKMGKNAPADPNEKPGDIANA